MPVDYQGYLQSLKSPLEMAFAGYKTGADINKSREEATLAKLKQQALLEKQAQAKQLQSELFNLSTREYDTPGQQLKDIDALIIRNPTLSKDFEKIRQNLGEKQKEAEGKKALAVYTALDIGQIEIATDMLEEYKTAYENSGNEQQARNIDALINIVKSGNIKQAKIGVGMLASAALGGENAFENYTKIREELRKEGLGDQYKQLTPEEIDKLGLDKRYQYQQSPEGKITPIAASGTTINIESSGPPPKGWRYNRDADGRVISMEPIPGGPAEAEIEAGKKKEEINAGEESKYGNIVLDDAARLKKKIQDAPWYNPVLGISGKIISALDLPGSNRVDAQELRTAIVANIGFDRLQKMREGSPTGGALGNISDREVETLQAVLGSLSLSQSEDQLISNIDRLNEIYSAMLKKAAAYPNAAEFGFSKDQQQNKDKKTEEKPKSGIPDKLKKYL